MGYSSSSRQPGNPGTRDRQTGSTYRHHIERKPDEGEEGGGGEASHSHLVVTQRRGGRGWRSPAGGKPLRFKPGPSARKSFYNNLHVGRRGGRGRRGRGGEGGDKHAVIEFVRCDGLVIQGGVVLQVLQQGPHLPQVLLVGPGVVEVADTDVAEIILECD